MSFAAGRSRCFEQLVSSIAERKQRMASLVLKMSVSLDGYVAPIDGSTDWIAAGGSDDALSWTVETVSNAGAHLMGAHHLRGDGHPLARRLRAVRQADERDPQGR